MESQSGRRIEQEPIRGHEALEPPDAQIAQRYLDEADAVANRRERSVDRRSVARLQIINAVAIAGFLTAMAAAIRVDHGARYQVMLFSFLIWGQLTSGMVQRSGMQWRLTWSRWPLLLGGGVLLAVTLVMFGFVAFDPDLPAISIVIPGALVLLGLGGYGVAQLVRAPDVQPPRGRIAPMSRGVRWGTVLVGIALALLTMLAAAPDGVLTATLLILVVLMIVVWIAAARSDMGLPMIGASWRWPHLGVFGASACALALVALFDELPALFGVLSGAGMILLFVAVSFVPGRDPRD